ncbi:MAG TPA: glycosyltransferase family 39 protein [Bacteroidota bacterium]|nr:glycosyltransferase family 39 protein [Bacteroidota bacterium]
MKKYWIWAILLLAIGLRLYHINFPVAGWHSWRQADTAAIAKNFYENGFRLLFPQIDWGGNSPGYVESEFQLYPFLVALLYKIFGVDDMIGRLLSVLFSAATVGGLYLLTKKYCSDRVALWSAFIYAVIPLNIYFGRAFMPEPAMLMFSVFGIYWFSEWLDRGGTIYFVSSLLCIALAALLKIPALYLGLPLLFLSHCKYGNGLLKQKLLWLFVLLVFLPVALWYYHAHEIFLASGLTFRIWEVGTDKWGNLDIITTVKFYNDVFFKSIAERHLTYAGFIPFATGLSITRQRKEEKVFDFWLLAVVIYIIIVARGNQVHEYYQLPFILPASVFAGKAFDKYLSLDSFSESMGARLVVPYFFSLCFFGLLVLSYLRYANFMKGEDVTSPLFKLGASVQSLTEKHALIVAVDEGNPVVLYRSDRKGWNSSPEDLDSLFLTEKKGLGAKFIAGERSVFETPARQQILKWLLTKYDPVIENNEYFILKL